MNLIISVVFQGLFSDNRLALIPLSDYPKTVPYYLKNRPLLRKRAAKQQPFFIMSALSGNTADYVRICMSLSNTLQCPVCREGC